MRLRRSDRHVGTGARDRWITLQSRSDDDTGGSGAPIDGDWIDLKTVAAFREDVEAVEVDRMQQEMAVLTTRWEIPYFAEMDPERIDVPKLRRLVYLGRAFDILAATPMGRQRAIEVITATTSKTGTV